MWFRNSSEKSGRGAWESFVLLGLSGITELQKSTIPDPYTLKREKNTYGKYVLFSITLYDQITWSKDTHIVLL